ncbi:S41 family peptidase [Tahibacter amnicola]|uniref:S41 family peptidase n=1 Tax=Tahibacter amnicola TaxID=2976241 RepID=A0ABY6BAE7_9GAMM|nr:S41 family peptidase [Tahibacter amnicola]UXI66639.1 S41 family peptidase [Tahibacter amnicola]
MITSRELRLHAFRLTGLLLLGTATLPAAAQSVPGTPGQADTPIDASQCRQVVENLRRELNARYVFPERAAQADKALRKATATLCAQSSSEKLGQALTEQLKAVTKDGHLEVFYSEEPVPVTSPDSQPSAEESAAELAMIKTRNFGIERVERLPFNIGFLDLRLFAKAGDAAPSIASAMTLLAHTDALIIDLRFSGGGDTSTVAAYASYLFDERTRLNDIYYRIDNRTEQMWTAEFVAGPRYGASRPVYVLTSKDTFSAAEDFTYALKTLKRATIVGETTGGGAHPGNIVRLHDHFAAFIPDGRSISPVTQTNWEGTGVAPDLAVPAPDAFNKAQIAILEHMLAAEKNPARHKRLSDRIALLAGEAGAR